VCKEENVSNRATASTIFVVLLVTAALAASSERVSAEPVGDQDGFKASAGTVVVTEQSPSVLGSGADDPASRADAGSILDVQWKTAGPLPNCETPRGRVYEWFEPRYDDSAWYVARMPAVNNVPARTDRFFRGRFYLPTEAEIQIEIKSDDGMWMWIDGESVGQDNAYQFFDWCTYEEGCYNGGNGGCRINYRVAPVYARLAAGYHVIAVDLENAIGGSYLSVVVRELTPRVQVRIAIDRGEGSHYRIGDPIRICYSVSQPIYLRFYDCQSGYGCRLLIAG